MTRPLRILVPLLALLASTEAVAYGVLVTEAGRVVRYTTPDLTYHLGTYIPASLGQAGLNAIEAGFAPWQQANCSVLSFAKVGTTAVDSVLPTGADANGKNEVIYSKGAYWDHGDWVLGVTVPAYLLDGRIVESDIAFNPSTPWTTSTSGAYGKMNLQGVSTHEIGHFFGLQHVLDYYGWGGDDMPTMVPSTEDGLAELTLTDDDLLGTCFLYPAGTFTCGGASQCPDIIDTYANGNEYIKASFACTAGTCTSSLVKEGTKGYGEECAEFADCKSPNFCQPLASGQVCTRECNPNANDCPNGDGCLPYADRSNVGVCFPTTHYELGHTCTSAYECSSGLCYPNPDDTDRFCRQSCQVSSGNCPAGFTCLSYTGIDYGGCIPDGLIGPAPGAVGDPCDAHGDCASEVCGEGTCRKACTSDAQCGAGLVCRFFAGRQGCTAGSGTPTGRTDGEPCAADADCSSGRCEPLPGTDYAYCRSACVAGGACPQGTTCVLYDDAAAGVCMPTANATGAACSNNNDCTTKICHSTGAGVRRCVEACRDTPPRCPDDTSCAEDATFGPVCLPGSTGGGDVPAGGDCAQDGECSTGLCHGAVCTLRCDAFRPSCPDSFGCLALGDGNSGGCVPVGGADEAEACADDTDCATALCASLGQGGRCVRPCDRTDPSCPAGQSCVAMGGYDVLGVCYGASSSGDDPRDGGATGMCSSGPSARADAWSILALLAGLALALAARRRAA